MYCKCSCLHPSSLAPIHLKSPPLSEVSIVFLVTTRRAPQYGSVFPSLPAWDRLHLLPHAQVLSPCSSHAPYSGMGSVLTHLLKC